MKMTLPRFGLDEVEIDPNTLIEFPNELLGLEGCKHFKLFHSENNPLIFWLQSIDDPEVVLTLTDPDTLHIFYDMALTDEELHTLQVDAEDELQVAVTLAKPDENNIAVQTVIQANFRSPIVINVTKRIALQKPLHNSPASIRIYHPVIEAQADQVSLAQGYYDVAAKQANAKGSLSAVAS